MKTVILECELDAELSRSESDFVAIAGNLHLMEHGHESPHWHSGSAGLQLGTAGMKVATTDFVFPSNFSVHVWVPLQSPDQPSK